MELGYTLKPEIAVMKFRNQQVYLALIPRHTFLREKPMVDDLYVIASINKQCKMHFRLPAPDIANYLARKGPKMPYDFYEQFCEYANPFPSSMIIGYEAPGKPLDKELVRSDGIFPGFPEIRMPNYSFDGKYNTALIVQNATLADFRQGDKEWRYTLNVPENRVVLIENFPQQLGYFAMHPKFPIPIGKAISPRKKGARLLRRSNEPDIEFLSFSPTSSSEVIANGHRSNYPQMLVIEMPQQDVALIKKLGELTFFFEGHQAELPKPRNQGVSRQ